MKKTAIPSLSDQILAAIRDIQEAKRVARRHPDHALLIQDGLWDQFSPAFAAGGFDRLLTRLETEGKIRRSRTINDTALAILQESVVPL